MLSKLLLKIAGLPPVAALINWLVPNGIQGERGGWKDDDV